MLAEAGISQALTSASFSLFDNRSLYHSPTPKDEHLCSKEDLDNCGSQGYYGPQNPKDTQRLDPQDKVRSGLVMVQGL